MSKVEQTKQVVKPDCPNLGEYTILTVKTLKAILGKIDDSKHNYAIEFRNPAGDLDFASLSHFALVINDDEKIVTFSEDVQ